MSGTKISPGVKDMTTGSPGKLIFRFALSLMLGNVFQQLYTFADTMIVGRCLGVNALAALGATEWLTFMMFGCVQGITQGFSISISQKFGKHDRQGLEKDVVHSAYLSIGTALILTAAGLLLCRPVLQLLKTPEDIIGLSFAYLKILYGGVAVSVFYNLLAAILRAIGDSWAPLKAVTAASLCNIFLDIVFVAVFHWGIQGAAFATMISQAAAALYCLAVLWKMNFIKPDKASRKPDISCIRHLLALSLPIGLQNMITGTGGIIVQSVINGFGILFIAGFTAANKLYGLLEIAASSYGYAVASYTGQNMGAGLLNRIRKGLKDASVLGILTAYVMSFIMLVFGKRILGCFVTGDVEAVEQTIAVGYEFLIILAIFFPLLYLLYILRSCIQGMGNTVLPMISSMVQLFMRVGCALFLTEMIGQRGVFFGEILAWTGADILLFFAYLYQMKKMKSRKTVTLPQL
ncbi:MAG: MATE family efflux transporter [Lachnospiraceae bacterium]|nr:MATE family efflux transporter [Lachnospiraceae bacterium]